MGHRQGVVQCAAPESVQKHIPIAHVGIQNDNGSFTGRLLQAFLSICGTTSFECVHREDEICEFATEPENVALGESGEENSMSGCIQRN